MNTREQKSRGIVTAFHREADFFAEWGMRALQRNNHTKALQCFKRAMEMEPSNANYYCNTASVLAEMGKFEDSNDLLFTVIEEIDPSLLEVYFYLANNFANMDEFEMAADMALKYLKKDEEGAYAVEAQELLHYIYFELDMPPRDPLENMEDDPVTDKHEEARKQLEAGRFMQAVDNLKLLIKEQPDFMPAWNNLALAYYYIGNFDKAMETIELALEKEPGNLHAICNMAVLLSHHNRWKELVPVIARLKKVRPFHYEHMYKLATTMGVLGQHEEAYQMYSKILKQPIMHDVSTYHYAATSAYLSGKYNQAKNWWKKVRQLDEESGIADYYLNKADQAMKGMPPETIPYHYQHPMREVELSQTPVSDEDFKANPMIRASLLWALQHGKEESKESVIRTLGMIGDEEAISTLTYFIEQTPNEELKVLAHKVIADLQKKLLKEEQQIAHLPEASEWNEKKYPTIGMEDNFADCDIEKNDYLTLSEEEYVLQLITNAFPKPNDQEKREWMMARWKDYCLRAQLPTRIRKEETWVAALEYLFEKNSGQLTQSKAAENYGVSKGTLSKCLQALASLD
ncbi:tetratricopeptide repeat protein [Brevibacillus daliensis]|uniref:tetratricopeptide repeat protein n=1 Tax=Brevibacillus daliensis TaxID=2892995 RepID=UPI001E3D85BD|nr:tetratricopeptide repeat protein [Brevibacillus daliensis]